MILLDTNILVFAHNADSCCHTQARELISNAMDSQFESCISHQNVLEFFSIVTNPKRLEKPLSLTEAFFLTENYLSSNAIIKICPSPATLCQTMAIAKKLSLTKAEIFDCYLAQTMLVNNVFTIYTENTVHFKHYKDIKAINPFLKIP